MEAIFFSLESTTSKIFLKKKTRESVMKTIINLSANLVFALFILFFVSCNSSDKQEAKDIDSSKTSKLNTDGNDRNPAIDTTKISPIKPGNLEKIPHRIPEETSRYIDDNGYLCIDLLESNIPTSKQEETLQKLFPGSKIQLAETGDKFTSYNILYQGNDYNVTIISEEDQQLNKKVLGFMFIAQGKFKIEILGDIYS